MTPRVLCFVSAKGGSGKTVTSSALGTFLGALGFKVLLVDTDAATNGMTLLYLEQLLGTRQKASIASHTQVGLFDVTDDENPTQIEVGPNLDFVPATFRMSDTETVDHELFARSLQKLVEDKSEYDFIFLDAQAGTDAYAKTAAKIADVDLIVSEYDPVSAQGIERLKILFSDVMNTSSTWTLFNKVLPEFSSVIGEGLSIARYLPPVPWDADVVRAFARRDLAINMERPNPYTLAIAQLAYDLFPDEAGQAIESWRGSAFEGATSPVERRLEDLRLVERELLEQERRSGIIRRGFRTLVELLAATVAMVAVLASASIFTSDPGELFSLRNSAIYFAALVGLMAVGGILVASRSADKSSLRAQDRLASLHLVRKELVKLNASLEATKAVFKANERAGIYEKRRRKESPLQGM